MLGKAKRLLVAGALTLDVCLLAAGVSVIREGFGCLPPEGLFFWGWGCSAGLSDVSGCLLIPAVAGYLLWAGGYYERVVALQAGPRHADLQPHFWAVVVAGSAAGMLGARWTLSYFALFCACLGWCVCYQFAVGPFIRGCLLRLCWWRGMRSRVVLVATPRAAAAAAAALARHAALVEPVGVCWLDCGTRAAGAEPPPELLGRLPSGKGLTTFMSLLIQAHAGGALFADFPSGHAKRQAAVDTCQGLGIDVWQLTAGPRAVGDDGLARTWRGGRVVDVAVRDVVPGQLLVKELIDIVLSVAALILAAPLLLCIALLVRLTSPGPVLFSQWRDGLYGHPFRIYKFRSMRADAEPDLPERHAGATPDILYKPERDHRVTRLGYLLRRSSLDELPQFWNVVRGDMSLVGPRPMRPVETAHLPEPFGRRRLCMKPGITGLWQVSGRSRIRAMSARVALDLDYVDNWSLRRDVKILLRTVIAVVSARGAQ